ncbi:MAG: M23 family metallopeptidase [Dongiaceae bacterium]
MIREPAIGAAFAAVFAMFLAGAPPTLADTAPTLLLPIDCVPGSDCWIVHYFDHDPGPGAKDYACGSLVYDGHDGVDIAIRDQATMRDGVEVRAAAAGTVTGTRDGMPDISVKEIGADKIKDRECGNGVNIELADGWSTQYCHMRRGSIAVKTGDKIAVGQRLGLIGLSGKTEFPHLHLTVRHEQQKIDPFIGLGEPMNCAIGSTPLWDESLLPILAYHPVAIYNSGFTDREPTWDEVKDGQHHATTVPANAGALVFWAEIYGVVAGDQITMRITGPSGNIVSKLRRSFQKTQIRRFEYIGKPGGGTWPSGRYVGEVVILHHGVDGNTEFRRDEEVNVP